MSAVKERFESLRRSTQASICVACGKCSTMCPEAPVEDFSARRIVNQELRQHENGQDVGVFRCLTCGSCELRCPQGVKISELVRGLRELVPPPSQQQPPHGAVFQRAAGMQAERGTTAKHIVWLDETHRVARTGDLALFVGCLPAFDLYFSDSLGVRMLDIARSAVTILNTLGIEPVIVDEELCCGHDLLWAGDRDSFSKLARRNTELFAARGVEHIITTCGECCRTWKLDYADTIPDFHPRVQHISEYLAEQLGHPDFRSIDMGPTPVTIQDSCRLARHLDVVEAPRQVLEELRGIELREMPRSGRDADCCGTSGFIHCDAQSKRIQRKRLQSAAETGARTITTSCPKCLIHFRCSQVEDERNGHIEPGIDVTDFSVLVASRLRNRTNGATR